MTMAESIIVLAVIFTGTLIVVFAVEAKNKHKTPSGREKEPKC